MKKLMLLLVVLACAARANAQTKTETVEKIKVTSNATDAVKVGTGTGTSISGAAINVNSAPDTMALHVVSVSGTATGGGSVLERQFAGGGGIGLAAAIRFIPSTGVVTANDGIGLVYQSYDSNLTIRTYASQETIFRNTGASTYEGELSFWLAHKGADHVPYFSMKATDAGGINAANLLAWPTYDLVLGPNFAEGVRLVASDNSVKFTGHVGIGLAADASPLHVLSPVGISGAVFERQYAGGGGIGSGLVMKFVPSSGVVAANDGLGLNFQAPDDALNNRQYMTLTGVVKNVGALTYEGELQINVAHNGVSSSPYIHVRATDTAGQVLATTGKDLVLGGGLTAMLTLANLDNSATFVGKINGTTSKWTGIMQFGGTTSSFPALKVSGVNLNVRKADDTANANMIAGRVDVDSGFVAENVGGVGTGFYGFSASTFIYAPTNGQIRFDNNSSSAGIIIDFTTSGTAKFRTRTNSADGTVQTGNLTVTAIPSLTGTRFLCISTTGVVSSSASACSGT